MKQNRLSYGQRIELCVNPTAKKLLHIMDSKKTNLAVSADVTSAKELIVLAETLGDEICVLKTHIDIIDDFTPDLTKQLMQLAAKHQFILFEDRKFADIGNTVMHQYRDGIFRIADWADVVNAHVLPGPGIIKGLQSVGASKNRGLILLAEMSSAGHLMDAGYVHKTLAMAHEHKDFVIGFITQHAVSADASWINLTPGVKLENSGDKLGQQYVTPYDAIFHNGNDVIIVGRGIIAADDVLAAAKLYRDAGWKAYLEAL